MVHQGLAMSFGKYRPCECIGQTLWSPGCVLPDVHAHAGPISCLRGTVVNGLRCCCGMRICVCGRVTERSLGKQVEQRDVFRNGMFYPSPVTGLRYSVRYIDGWPNRRRQAFVLPRFNAKRTSSRCFRWDESLTTDRAVYLYTSLQLHHDSEHHCES